LKGALERSERTVAQLRADLHQTGRDSESASQPTLTPPVLDAEEALAQAILATIDAGLKPVLTPAEFLARRNDTDILYWNVHGHQIASSLISALNADSRPNMKSLTTKSALSRARMEALVTAALGYKPAWHDGFTPSDRASLLPWLEALKRELSPAAPKPTAQPGATGLGSFGRLLEQAKRKG
jgi:hypothetical protein